METRANDRDLIGSYRTADPQGRLEIVFANYHIFPIYAECTAEKKQEVFATLNGKIMIK